MIKKVLRLNPIRHISENYNFLSKVWAIY